MCDLLYIGTAWMLLLIRTWQALATCNTLIILKHVFKKCIFNKMYLGVSTFLLALILNSVLFSFLVKLEYLSRIFALVPCC